MLRVQFLWRKNLCEEETEEDVRNLPGFNEPHRARPKAGEMPWLQPVFIILYLTSLLRITELEIQLIGKKFFIEDYLF